VTGIDPQQDRLIAAYIRGTADPEAVARLEEAMLDDDELFERVQQEALLQRGLKTTLVDSDSSGTSKSAFWRWPGFALLGTLGLAVVVLGGWIVQLQQQIDHLQAPQTGIPVITLHDQRSVLAADSTPTLDGLPIAGPILVELDVSALAGQDFGIEIQTAGGRYQWTGQQPDWRGYLTVSLQASDLPARLVVLSPEGQPLREFELVPTL